MADLDVNEMRQIKRDKLDKLISQGNDPHTISNFPDRIFAKSIVENYDAYEEKSVRLAGRIMSKRGHGKVSFMDLQDSTGRIQLFNRLNDLGEDAFDQVRDLDIGDIIGVEGEVFTTKTGEISIRSKSITLLTKSLQILPEKFHGLTDPDLRYRQRYVDLIMNPEVKEAFLKRTKIISEIRSFLNSRGYLEVETPILNTIAGGANAKPFITHHNTLDIDMYLRIANELYLKRLIVGGFEKVYEMGRMFRNEGMDSTHNPEYTAIELYAAYEDYHDMMEITEELVNHLNNKVNGSSTLTYKGQEIDTTPPWRRVTMVDIIKEETGIDFEDYKTDEEARQLAKEKNIEVEDFTSRGEIIQEFFEEFCEDKIIQPTFVTRHPVEVSPLAKRDSNDPRYTERFEAFVAGDEIGNAFSELNDARDQRQRFEAQVKARERGDDEAQMMDNDFINALEVGLPPTGGLGIGVDRLVMILTGQESIRDVILFPTMKPVGADKHSSAIIDTKDQDFEKIDLSKLKVEPLFEEDVDFETFSKSDFRAVKVLNCEEVPKSKKLLKFTLDDGSGEERTILSGIKDYYSAEKLVGKTLLAITNLPPRKMMGIESEGMILSTVIDYDGEERLNLVILENSVPAGAKLY